MATYKGVVPLAKYTFNPTLKTITFDVDYTGIALSDIMLITNVKSGIAITIYDPFDPLKGGSLAGLVLTLVYDTTSMAAGDSLQIIVGMVNLPTALPAGASTEATLSTLSGKIPTGLTVTSSKLDVNIGTNGTVGVTSLPALSAGTNAIGSITNASFAVTQNAATSLKTQAEVYQGGVAVSSSAPLAVSSAASISGGVSCKTGSSQGGNFSLAVKSGPGQVYGWYFYNPNTAVAYVKIYNLSSGNPSSPDPVCVLPIPPVSGANVFGIGIPFDSNICITIATTRGGAGILALDVDYNIFYK